jgi:hypothetical protein
MAHAQKPDFVFRRNGRVHLNRQRRQLSRLLAAEVCASAVVMLDTPCSEVVWRVLATHSIRHFPLHFPPYVTVCHHISTGLYQLRSQSTVPPSLGLSTQGKKGPSLGRSMNPTIQPCLAPRLEWMALYFHSLFSLHGVHRDKFTLPFTSKDSSQGGWIGVGKCILLYAQTRLDDNNLMPPEIVGRSAKCSVARGCKFLPTNPRFMLPAETFEMGKHLWRRRKVTAKQLWEPMSCLFTETYITLQTPFVNMC